MDNLFITPSSLEEFVSMYKAEPDDFRVLCKIPLVKSSTLANLPLRLAKECTDEQLMVILKLYTSGQNYQKDTIIELAMTKARYSPSLGCITEISGVYRGIEDPRVRISDKVMLQTGLDNDNLAGRVLDQDETARFLAGVSLVVCHNAMFERQFFEKKFPLFNNLNWVSSLREIPWRGLDNSIRSLELTSILLSRGYFFTKKTALDETLALAWVLIEVNGAFKEILRALEPTGAVIYAFGAPYEIKDVLKQSAYHWDRSQKVWYKMVLRLEYVEHEINFLQNLYDHNRVKLKVKYLSANVRYKHDML